MSELNRRGDRVARYLADQKAAEENLAAYPETIRNRLHTWQTARSEWFSETLLEVLADFIAFEDATHTKALIDGAGEVEKRLTGTRWPEGDKIQAAATIAALRAEVERKDAAIGSAIGAICFTYDDPDSAVVTELHAALSARGLDIREIEK